VHNNGLSRRGLIALSAGLPTIGAGQAAQSTDGYVDILRPPDFATAFLESETITLARDGHRWTAKGIAVEAEPHGSGLPVRIQAPEAALMRVRLRWKAKVPERWRILNDQWERSYGDLEWRGLLGERILPWYFLAFDGQATHGYGVATGASSFAFWQVDPVGISLWIDLRNGGGAVRLGERTLEAATVRVRRGNKGETAFESAHRFCRVLCDQPRLAPAPIYGANYVQPMIMCSPRLSSAA
jgi:alpha-galactosidase